MFSLIPWKKKREGNGGALAHPEMYPLARFRQEFDNLLDRFWNDWPEMGMEPARWGWGMDVEDKENEVVVRTEAPGYEPDEFDVQLSGNHLIVKAEHKEEQKGEAGSSYRYGRFHRMVPLPHGVEPENIEARYHSGVLTIRVPKTEETKGKRIPVKAS
jgi:HSP20 family protein